MKSLKVYTKIIMILAILVVSPALSRILSAEVVDKVIIVINDEVVTQREYNRAFAPIKQNYERNFEGEELAKRLEAAEKGLKDHLINTKLAISLAKKNNVKIDEEELAGKIDKVRAYYGTEEEFLLALSERGTNLTEFEREIREQMLAQALMQQEVAQKIVITPGEIRDLYEKNKENLVAPKQVKVRSIMVRKSMDEAENKKARRKIENLLGQVKSGKDFATLAKESSEGPYADKGGEWGYVPPGNTVKEVDEVIFSLDVDKPSDIVETNIGYHIFLVEDVKEPKTLELQEVNAFLREQLYMKKFQEGLVKYLEEERKKAYISYK